MIDRIIDEIMTAILMPLDNDNGEQGGLKKEAIEKFENLLKSQKKLCPLGGRVSP